MDKHEIEDMMSNLLDYLESNGIDTRSLFTCINPQHPDKHPSMKYFDDNKVYCYGCGASYNIVDCISVMENLDHKEAFKKAINYYCHNLPSKNGNNAIKQKIKPQKQYIDKDYSKAYFVWHKNLMQSELAKKYLAKRGIDLETAEKFNLGFNNFEFKKFNFNFNAIVIPATNTCYSARNLSNTDKIRYYKPKGCQACFFNLNAISNDNPICVITEGEFDAMSFETIGVNSLSLCSVNNLNKFITMQKPLNKIYILALDNDEMGKKHEQILMDYFDENKISYTTFDNCGFKDANQALVNDKETFVNAITKLCEEQIRRYKKQQAEM